MSKWAIVLTILLSGLYQAAAAAGGSRTVQFTGSITVTVDGNATTYSADANGGAPLSIPDGAVVAVVSGAATFQTQLGAVSCVAGDSFSVSASRGVETIAAISGTPSLSVGDTTAALSAGSGVSLTIGEAGTSLTVTQGTVSVSAVGGTATTLAAGGSVIALTSTGQGGGGGGGGGGPNLGGRLSGGGGGGSASQEIHSGLLSGSHP